MPEKTRKLQKTLEELHAELDRAELDAELRSELRRTADEIRDALASSGTTAPDLPATIGDRLRAAIERFEQEHPKLTLATGRVVDALAEMGL